MPESNRRWLWIPARASLGRDDAEFVEASLDLTAIVPYE
jgi:hypothetical protein